MSDSLRLHGLLPARLLCPWDSSGKNTGVGCHALLQVISPTQGWKLCLLHCGWIPYCWTTGEAPFHQGDSTNRARARRSVRREGVTCKLTNPPCPQSSLSANLLILLPKPILSCSVLPAPSHLPSSSSPLSCSICLPSKETAPWPPVDQNQAISILRSERWRRGAH